MSARLDVIADGYRRARAVTRKHAKSFYFASFALFGERRRAAYALYVFCRRLDDLVDHAQEDWPSLNERLNALRARVSALFLDPEGALASKSPAPWHPSEWLAFADTIARHRIPEAPFQELISGMEMDLHLHRYPDYPTLELYCHRAAGTVGLMMAPMLGARDPAAARPAADLGKAMQLTNILRDVKEDWERGRCYLPADELASFGLEPEALAERVGTPRWDAMMRFQIARARQLYARAAEGLQYLEPGGARRLVRVMGAVYSEILSAIERQGYDVFSNRARVPLWRKLWVAFRGARPVRANLSAPELSG